LTEAIGTATLPPVLLRGCDRKRIALATLATLASLLSCGGRIDSEPPGAVTGTIGGDAVPTTSVAAFVFRGGPTSEEVALTNQSDTCAAAAHEFPLPPNLVVLGFEVEVPGASVGVGTYSISSPPAGVRTFASFSKADAQGGLLSQTYATGGSFTYADVSATAVSGSFDLAFGTDHVAGTFVAKVCTN
jgi:hypothetical protein